jgi:P27 family predicted phage terminase small subunit
MASRAGRPPETTKNKVLRGDFRARDKKARANEPTPGKGEPECPEWMPAYGRELFSRMAGELRRMKMLHRCDEVAFLAMCSAWAEWLTAEDELKDGMTTKGTNKIGATYEMTHPAIAIRSKARKDCVTFAREFGLTPTSRAKASAADPSEGTADAWDNLDK